MDENSIKLIALIIPFIVSAYKIIVSYLKADENREIKIKLLEFYLVPENVLALIKDAEINNQEKQIKLWRGFFYTYTVLLILQIAAVIYYQNFREFGFAVIFLLLCCLFYYRKYIAQKIKRQLKEKGLLPVRMEDKFLIKEFLFGEDIEFLVNRAVSILRKQNANIYLLKRLDTDHFHITAFNQRLPSLLNNLAYPDVLTELNINFSRKAERECLVKIESSLNKNLSKSLKFISTFINLFLTQEKMDKGVLQTQINNPENGSLPVT